MAALGGDLYCTVLGGLYSVFLRGILFAEVVLEVTKRINDWRLLGILQAKKLTATGSCSRCLEVP